MDVLRLVGPREIGPVPGVEKIRAMAKFGEASVAFTSLDSTLVFYDMLTFREVRFPLRLGPESIR